MNTNNIFRFNPFIAWLNVNQACNLRCKWCYAEYTEYLPKQEMSLEMAKHLVELSLEIGVKEFVLIGGEPTLWPHLFELLTFIKKYDAPVSIITNAIHFSNDDFWERYQNNPANSVGISVKAVDREKFNSVTNSVLYDESLLGIKRAINFYNCGVSAVHNSLLGVNGTLEIARQCRQLGATSFQLVLCTPVLRGEAISTEFVISPANIWEDLHFLSQNIEYLYGMENVNYDTQMPLCLFPKEFVKRKLLNGKLQSQCHVFSRSGINFDFRGNVLFCNTIAEIIARYGVDFIDAESLINFMSSEQKRAEYRQVLRYPSKECRKCIWREDCRGGCLMNWFVYDPDEICRAVE